MMAILMVEPVGNNDVMVGASSIARNGSNGHPISPIPMPYTEPCFFSTKLLLSFIHAPNTVKHE